jgi:hypothetical protein
MSANDVRGLRGPGGFLVAGFCVVGCIGAAELDADAFTLVLEDEESGAGEAADDNSDVSNRGHFFASSESSGTSTTSLHTTTLSIL